MSYWNMYSGLLLRQTTILKFFFLAVLSIIGSLMEAQEETAPAFPSAPAVQSESHDLRLRDLEPLVLSSLRQQFPRLPGIFASVQTCRLPDYGPLITVTIQPPLNYFTRPILLELERRQRIAEEQARKIRTQIDRAAQLISLKAKEADLLEKLQEERSSKKRGKSAIAAMETDLGEVRKSLGELQTDGLPQFLQAPVASSDVISEADLNKMLMANYQQLIQKLTEAMTNCLAEYGPALKDLKQNERICITAHVRDNFLGNHEKGIIFVLHSEDIQAFKNGNIDLAGLKKKVQVQYEPQE